MTRLDDYQSAMLAANPEVEGAALGRALDEGGRRFVSFIIDHGLGPLWHQRTDREEFHASRVSAEALFLAQEHALLEIDALMGGAGIDYAVIKGAANRLLLKDNPAIRACYDLDLLVHPEDRVTAASELVNAGFSANPVAGIIGHELVLSRGVVDVDLHWGLMREGRLRDDCTATMLGRRRRSCSVSMLKAEDALFVLLVHPAFAKHLAGCGMGLHRVVDIVEWLQKQSFDWHEVRELLERNGVQTAAWATLRWVEMLTRPQIPAGLTTMVSELRPGWLRRSWLDVWLRNDLSERTSGANWVRLLGFSMFLHDSLGDSARVFASRHRSHRRSGADLAAFEELIL